MPLYDVLVAALFGVVEGITEWLPISSTGHMILLGEFIDFSLSPAFSSMFLIVVQLGAILAVVVLYWRRLVPLVWEHPSGTGRRASIRIDRRGVVLWAKIVVATIPAAIVGVLWDDAIDAIFYNPWTVATALIVFGVAFLLVERAWHDRSPKVTTLDDITFGQALVVGLFQLVAAVFPGTSRSGATILGGFMLGLSRAVAAEFTFLLAVPTMLGASLLKVGDFGLTFTPVEAMALATGMVVAFLVSLASIRFLVGYIKTHDFTVFGWYRIVLGAAVLLYFVLAR